MATYRPRSAWTSTAARGDTLPAANVEAINIHYPGSGNAALNGLTEAQVASRLRGWRDWHINGRGWVDIGYNMAVDGSGRIWTLRGLDRVGAHSATSAKPNENRRSIGVLFVVGNNERPTPAAVAAFRQLRADILKRSPRATTLRGHQQVPGASTACPGDALMDLIRDGGLTGKPTTPPTPPEDFMSNADAFLAALKDERVRSEMRNIAAEGYRDGPTTRREIAEIFLTAPIGRTLLEDGKTKLTVAVAFDRLYKWARDEAAAGNPRARAALASMDAVDTPQED